MDVKIDTTLEEATISEQLGFTKEFFDQKFKQFFADLIAPNIEPIELMGMPLGLKLQLKRAELADYLQKNFKDEEILFMALSSAEGFLEPFMLAYITDKFKKPEEKESTDTNAGDGESTS